MVTIYVITKINFLKISARHRRKDPFPNSWPTCLALWQDPGEEYLTWPYLYVPTLYMCPVDNVLGRVPLLPCYLKGSKVNTIPYSCRSQIPRGAAAASDSRQDSGTGSRLFEVNI